VLVKSNQRNRGFTIVELLIVIVVIAILAAITIIAYNGIQSRSHTTSQKATAASLAKKVEGYNAINNMYPALTDSSSRNTTAQLNLNTTTALSGSGTTLGTSASGVSDNTVELRLCSSTSSALSGTTPASGFIVYIYDQTKGFADPVQAGGNVNIMFNSGSTANTVNYTSPAVAASCVKAS
jgi:prepilin-type N-terminal cleavage/methylation domain-containing protein